VACQSPPGLPAHRSPVCRYEPVLVVPVPQVRPPAHRDTADRRPAGLGRTGTGTGTGPVAPVCLSILSVCVWRSRSLAS
jgi:hypothetical protein